MKRMIQKLLVAGLSLSILAACGGAGGGNNPESGGNASGGTLTMVWYPNESGADMQGSRDEIGKYIEEATGKKVEHKLTTDYAIAIEAIANGQANLAFMGAQGYVEARNKNAKVDVLAVPSGKSGTLDDAIYYSWLAVNKGNEAQYSDGQGAYKIDNIKGKKMSFVSNSSTSGFVVPTSNIINVFKDEKLTQDDLMQGGADKFFSEVMFGGSHQGSAVNLLSDKADVAAFCDTCVANYVELKDGEENKEGTTMAVKQDAADPLSAYKGKEFVIIDSLPVLNAPFAVNTEATSEEDVKKIKEVMLGDTVNNDPKIWRPTDSKDSTLFKKEGDSKFVAAEDKWFDPIRDIAK